MDLKKLFSGEELSRKETREKKQIVSLVCEIYEKTDIEKDRNERLCNYKKLRSIPGRELVDFFDTVSNSIQENMDSIVDDPAVKNIMDLADYVNTISDETRKHEILTAMKLVAESNCHPPLYETKGIIFKNLYKYLYSAMAGKPSNVELDKPTLQVLMETYEELMQKVEEDATPEKLLRLQSLVGNSIDSGSFKNFEEIQKIFQDPSLNIFNLPFEECLFIDPTKHSKETEASVTGSEIIIKEEIKSEDSLDSIIEVVNDPENSEGNNDVVISDCKDPLEI